MPEILSEEEQLPGRAEIDDIARQGRYVPTGPAQLRRLIIYINALHAREAARTSRRSERIEAAAKAFYEQPMNLTTWDSLVESSPDIAVHYRASMARALEAADKVQADSTE